jgi:large conductance mechanosensitive channel
MFKDFKEFVMRGNMLDMAVGIIIGAAFGTIVKSLVADVIMPPIGLLLGGVDFSNFFAVLKGADGVQTFETLAAAKEAGAVTINWGVFLNAVISFLIIAFVLFMIIRVFNRLKRQEEPAPEAPTTKECPFCLSKIPIKATKCGFCTSALKD